MRTRAPTCIAARWLVQYLPRQLSSQLLSLNRFSTPAPFSASSGVSLLAQPNHEPPSDPDGISFEKVVELDAQFQKQNSAVALDPLSEAAALRACFQGEKEPIVRDSCCALFSETGWNQLKSEWESWKNKDDAVVGSAVKDVVDELEAQHLRPTGILSRLEGGVKPACHGLQALLNHLKSRK